MKHVWLALLLTLIPLNLKAQDPVIPKRDNIYVEFLTDCDWSIYGLEGKFKLHPQHNNAVGFRAWTPYMSLVDVDIRGRIAWRNINYQLAIRDCIIFPWSSTKITYPFEPGTMPKWDFVVHYNVVVNADTHMRVWGPCEVVRLDHGEAWVTHGDRTFFVKVDENDYLNYPPWEISLK